MSELHDHYPVNMSNGFRRMRACVCVCIPIIHALLCTGCMRHTTAGIAGQKHGTPAALLGITFVQCPPGEYMMGTPADEVPSGLEGREKQRSVKIEREFWISACEITNAQFRQFVVETGYAERPDEKSLLSRLPQAHMESVFQCDDAPVVFVNWHDAREFCRWISKKEGRVVRLPTSEEWEYACRAGSREQFHFGADPELLSEYAWIRSNSAGSVHSVGKKRPSAWGLYDIHGNVWEWCSDIVDSEIVDATPFRDKTCAYIRGGSYQNDPGACRCACDWAFEPVEYRSECVGFRIVCESPTNQE